MLMRGAEAGRYLAKPDAGRPGLLIYGADAMRVAMKRQGAIAALIGPEGPAEMRLTRLSGALLRKDAAALLDAIKAVGFFPGPRVVFVEEATDGLTDLLLGALKSWRPGDATLLVSAGNLTAKSALKSLFEKHPTAVAIGLYDDPPTREEIEAELRRAGISDLSGAAMADLAGLSKSLEPSDFRQMLEKIALYKWQDPTPLTPAEIHLMAPATTDAEVDDLLHAVAERQAKELGLMMRRLEAQGVTPVTLCIQALRHFRALHLATSDPGGIGPGLQRARVFGPRRDRMQRQAQAWGMRALEGAIAQLVETDLTLRSASKAPMMALVERALIRIAMMRRA